MSVVDAIVGRVKATAAKAPAMLMLTHNKDWSAMLAEIDEKHTEVSGRRDALVAERDAAVVASVAGDSSAGGKADDLDVQIVTTDRELSRLGTARASAAKRIALEEQGRAGAAEQARDNRVKKLVRAVQDGAQAADEALAKFRDALAAVTKDIGELRAMAGPELNVTEWRAYTGIVVDAVLSEIDPLRFKKSSTLAADRLTLAGNAARIFEPEYVVGIAQRAKR
jgi:hypothetical protein